MTISLRDLMDDDTASVSQQALNNNLTTDGETPYIPFTLRELITPQYEVDVTSESEEWANWVYQHSENRTVYTPETRKQVIAAVVTKAQSDVEIRAVGSGHSHSNAPEPPEHYIDLNPGDPESAENNGLNDVLINGPDENRKYKWLKGDRDHEYLHRLHAGVTIRRLNRHVLHPNGYALENMGSFDGQTLAGAINTSTHGTGVTLSSVADAVESVEIVTVPESESGDPIVRAYRIEPSDGITDRESFEEDVDQHRTALIQDDDVFKSTVVGYGCMGVAVAYTMRVRDSYWLREETRLLTWETLVSELEDGNGEVTDESVENFLTNDGCRHTQILLNLPADQLLRRRYFYTHVGHGSRLHERPGNPICLVKRHYEVPDDEIPRKPEGFPITDSRTDSRWPPERPPQTARYLSKDIEIHPLARNTNKAILLHRGFFHGADTDSPFIGGGKKTGWYVALRRLRDGGGEDASEHYHPEPPEPPAPTTEVGVELGNIVDAVNAARKKVFEISQEEPVSGKPFTKGQNVFFPAPMGIRFTAPSEHYLSPEYERKTAMLEVPMPIYAVDPVLAQGLPRLTFRENRDQVILPALSQLHNDLVFTGGPDDHEFDARPHMGKHNEIGKGWLDANYDRFRSDGDDETAWMDVYRRFNAFGTFDNKFTDQLGISRSGN